jgi:tRNA(Ser,Leu) C12 N-acetylase TAN1
VIGQHLAELYDILTGQQATINWAGIRDLLLTRGTYDSKLEELSLLLSDLPSKES